MTKICKLCYREVEEEDMQKNFVGEITDYCRTCSAIIGKGSGYSGSMSNEQADKWLTGIDERKQQLTLNGKI